MMFRPAEKALLALTARHWPLHTSGETSLTPENSHLHINYVESYESFNVIFIDKNSALKNKDIST